MTGNSVSSGLAWYCVRTQTRREHIAAHHLRELEEVEVFCPRLRYRKATRRGKVWWIEPMFPGYLLARFDLVNHERAVIYCQGVRGLVRFGQDVPPVAENFVAAIRRELFTSAEEDRGSEILTLRPVIHEGDDVEIAHGPLRGTRARVLSVAPAHERVKVLLEFLGQPQIVDVDLFSILMPRRPAP